MQAYVLHFHFPTWHIRPMNAVDCTHPTLHHVNLSSHLEYNLAKLLVNKNAPKACFISPLIGNKLTADVRNFPLRKWMTLFQEK